MRLFPNKSAPAPARENHLPTLSEPDTQESEFDPGDFEQGPYTPSEDDKKLITLTNDRFQQSADARKPHEPMIFESLAFYLGNQWVRWSSNSGALVSVRSPKTPNKIYSSHNRIKPRIKKLLARGTQQSPDASTAPDTASDMDMAAAAEGRAILAHYDNLYKRPQQVARMARYALTTTTCALKITWDPFLDADVPQMDAQGKLIGSTRAQVGDIREDLTPGWELYPDPKAKHRDDATWLIHAQVKPLSYLQERYKNGRHVEAGGGSGPGGQIDTRLASVVGDYSRTGGDSAKKSAVVIEMWEKPTQAYPKGRLVTVANNVLLRDDPWPYPKMKGFPFAFLDFEEGIGSFWGLNAVADLIEPQRDRNRRLSQAVNNGNSAYGKIFVERNSDIGADAFKSDAVDEVVYYNQGSQPPVHAPAPTLPPVYKELIGLDDADMDDISGVHEISNGTVPPGVTAASAIEMLYSSDTTQMSEFTRNLEGMAQERGQIEIILAAQFYSEPRLMYVSQATPAKQIAAPAMPPQGMPPQDGQEPPMGQPAPVAPGQPPQAPGIGAMPPAPQAQTQDDPLTPMMQVKSFKALTGGGSCRVIVKPGSATPKTPAAQNAFIFDLYAKGFYGPQGDPRGAIIALKQMDMARSDAAIEQLEAFSRDLIAEAKAAQPDPMAIAQMQAQHQAMQQQAQAQAAQQQAQMAQQHAAEMASIEHSNAAYHAQLESQHVQQLADLKQQHDATMAAINHAAELRSAQMEAQIKIATEQALRQLPPAIGPISVTADPTAVVAIEKEAGVEGAVPPPPKPAAPTSKPSGGAK